MELWWTEPCIAGGTEILVKSGTGGWMIVVTPWRLTCLRDEPRSRFQRVTLTRAPYWTTSPHTAGGWADGVRWGMVLGIPILSRAQFHSPRTKLLAP